MEIKLKKCSKCKEVKPIEEFGIDRRNLIGLNYVCKNCRSFYSKLKYTGNSKKVLNYQKIWARNNPDKFREIKRRWRKKHPENQKLWRKANPEKNKENSRRAMVRKYSTPKGKLSSNISCAIYSSLHHNKNGRHWEMLVGYTLPELMIHIEKQFKNGMNWKSFMRGEIHIDHKIPISAFNFEKSENIDFKKCWSLKNLQPMWAKKNISKGAKLDRPFQPSLLI